MAQEIKKQEAGHAPAVRYADPFAAMRAEMDRVFDSFLGRGFGQMPSLFRGDAGGMISPNIDVKETPTELVIEAELPGLEEKDVSATLNAGVLTLKGEKKSERDEQKDNYHLMERSYGSFQRSFQVGDAIDPEKVQATFEKGVLKVTLPKKADATKAERRIPIGKG